jgi:hypothetical protein
MNHEEDDIILYKSAKKKAQQDFDRLKYYRSINLKYEDDPNEALEGHRGSFKSLMGYC